MKIKDIIVKAMRLLGREDAAATLAGDGAQDAECAEVTSTLLYCVNAVEDELARYYFPPVSTEELQSASGKYYYSKLGHTPVRILSVTSAGEAVKYAAEAEYLQCSATSVSVEYEYVPAAKALDGDSQFGDEVGETLIAYGAASEYCVIGGEIRGAEMWESRYKSAIDGVRKKKDAGKRIPPRRWV